MNDEKEKVHYFYQLIFLGKDRDFCKELRRSLEEKINKLGISLNSIKIVSSDNFSDNYSKKNYSFCVYLADETDKNRDHDNLKLLQSHFVPILPLLDNLSDYQNKVPECLKKTNGMQISEGVEKITSVVLEGLSLLRDTRKVFISYKRKDTRKVAQKLFNVLYKSGFTPFLDSYSIRPTKNFQDELFDFMADCDVVILLNSKTFFEDSSIWTKEEFERANKMGIGILEILFDGMEKKEEAVLSHTISFPKDISCPLMKNKFFKDVVDNVESMRAESLMFRSNRLLSAIEEEAANKNLTLEKQTDGKIICLNNITQKKKTVVPIVGIPNSNDFDLHRKNIGSVPDIYFAYDSLNVIEKKQDYFDWLNQSLPIKTKKILEVEKWLN